MVRIVLKPGREKSLVRRHPWLFSGAIDRIEGDPKSGETVEIVSRDGSFLGWGAFSPHSQIMVRIWSFDPGEEIGVSFFRRRLEKSIGARDLLNCGEGTACRLVNAESDTLPGLIVDRYGDYLVCQFLSAGAEYWRDQVVQHLAAITTCQGIYERSDVDVRVKEGLPERSGLLFGKEPPELLELQEGPVRFLVDIRRGQKTGFYLDQRENRSLMARYAQGREILNVFAYTGGFGVWALAHGADRVVNIESSTGLLDLLEKNIRLNHLDGTRVENIPGDAFHVLRRMRDQGRSLDLVILDPPKFASSQAQVQAASRGYKDINLLAMKLLRPGGVLFTFSCSMAMGMDLFQKIVADAALDAGREAQILHRLGQSPDHPTLLSFPEGTYLKGLICRVA